MLSKAKAGVMFTIYVAGALILLKAFDSYVAGGMLTRVGAR